MFSDFPQRFYENSSDLSDCECNRHKETERSKAQCPQGVGITVIKERYKLTMQGDKTLFLKNIFWTHTYYYNLIRINILKKK